MNAEIISVGTELLLGHTINTDAAFVARELSAIGVNLLFACTVGDNPGRLRDALEEAYMHVLRKLHLYRDIQRSIETGEPYPDWANYDGKDFRADDR